MITNTVPTCVIFEKEIDFPDQSLLFTFRGIDNEIIIDDFFAVFAYLWVLYLSRQTHYHILIGETLPEVGNIQLYIVQTIIFPNTILNFYHC